MALTFDKILKILLKKGGYPSKTVSDLLEVLDISKHEFFKLIITHLGEKGAEKFFEKTIRNLSRDGKHFTFKPTDIFGQDTSKDFFIELDLSDVKIDLNTPMNTVIIDNWDFGDSHLKVENEEGDTFEGKIEDVYKWLFLEDPYYKEDLTDSLDHMIESNLQRVLGVAVYLNEKKVREEL
jgi:hypothetical protein